MSIRITLPDSVQENLSYAQDALKGQDFDRARALSASISAEVRKTALTIRGPDPSVSKAACILVVAWRRDPAHAVLTDLLCDLDQSDFNLMLVENSEYPLFTDARLAGLANCRILSLGANYGPGVARNLGIYLSCDETIMFLDDDGQTTVGAIRSLMKTRAKFDAVAVRGRASPFTEGTHKPPHYDLGNVVLRSSCDLEGISIWNRAAVARVGGFDPLLYGHEGRELVSRLFPQHGPDAFVYDPDALLLHDYIISDTQIQAKADRHALFEAYIRFVNPAYDRIIRAFYRNARGAVAREMLEQRERILTLTAAGLGMGGPTTVTLLTTCHNGARVIPRWVASLRAQTDADFQVVFVDDGSTDDSLAIARRAWGDDPRITITGIANAGRPAALNHALLLATTDLCVIADLEDISIPQRVAWTKTAFRENPQADMIGGMAFDLNQFALGTKPHPVAPTDLGLRAVFGAPCLPAALAWRRSRVTRRFDEFVRAGDDPGWQFRALSEDGNTGLLIPLGIVFHPGPGGQISEENRQLQTNLTVDLITDLHVRLLGRGDVDGWVVAQFARSIGIDTDQDLVAVRQHTNRLYDGAGVLGPERARALRSLLRDHLGAITLDFTRKKLRLAVGHATLGAAGSGPSRGVMTVLRGRFLAVGQYLRRLVVPGQK